MKSILDLIGRSLFAYMIRVGFILRCADAPDMTAMNTAAAASAELGKEALAWYKQQDAAAKPGRDLLGAKALEVADQQLIASKQQTELAKDYSDYNKSTFRPLEQGIVADANAYDTPERQQAAADAAMADTNIAFANTNDATARRLAANGIDPGSTRAMSVMSGQGVDQATANAGAAYKARKGVETVGHARQMDAASLGRGLSSNQATSAGLALTAGNSAVANTAVPVTAGNQATALTGQGYGTALQGQNIAGNLYGQAANAGKTDDSGIWGAVGTVAGAALMASDENLKTGVAPISDADALEATKATEVSKWKYDPAKMAAQGIDVPPEQQGENIGPMAQDVNATMGEEAAPGGKKLNLITMNGINMKAVQAVDKKVEGLAKQVSSLASLIRGGKVQAGAQA